ncbi:MAG: heterodisulfide reductase-related iron-sulfur binding cluster [Pseudomonadota bacterium]|nr:heterodisulfide reductase-related iron-sulfur binding cluster [Pseudomonadota bacterium]
MSEGSLGAPERRPILWENPEFYDEENLDKELRRQFDICHGCRRCHNLCDSFPRLFDLIDESESMELDTVKSEDFKSVVDACTLCDMCFLTKCPYVPPHEFNLDLPHLLLRYRAVDYKKGRVNVTKKQIAKTDRNGKIAGAVAPISNWATKIDNRVTRPLIESVTGIDKNAQLPQFHRRHLSSRKKSPIEDEGQEALRNDRKVVVYATCFVNYNDPAIGEDALAVLHQNGVHTEVLHPACCGMPMLEHGDIQGVAKQARRVATAFKPWIQKGYDVVTLTPSCSLMLKFEWPLILPGDEDIKLLSKATRDVSEYIVDISKKDGMAKGMRPLDGNIVVHISCHSRAQNMGQKAAELLRLIPGAEVSVIERCSGHGGSWGMMKDNFDTSMKIGRPVARKALETSPKYIVSECPLAGLHILQGMGALNAKEKETQIIPDRALHPIQLIANSYRRGKQ